MNNNNKSKARLEARFRFFLGKIIMIRKYCAGVKKIQIIELINSFKNRRNIKN